MPRTSGSGLGAAAVWAYPMRLLTNLFPHLLLYDIRLDGGTTQLLEFGLYTLVAQTDAYGDSSFGVAKMHIEFYDGAAWHNYATYDGVTGSGVPMPLLCDGNNLRAANGAGAGTWYRLIGVRAW